MPTRPTPLSSPTSRTSTKVHPASSRSRDWMIIDVDYRLMADNLLDLSHVNFLHEGLLGHSAMNDADVEIREDVESSGATTLYVTRTSRDVQPPYLFDLMYRNDQQPVDTWAEMRWNAPGYLRNHAGVTQPGASATTASWSSAPTCSPRSTNGR